MSLLWKRLLGWTLIFAAASPSLANGDVLVTKSGHEYEGQITEEDNSVTVVAVNGSKFTFPKASVQEVRQGGLTPHPPETRPASQPVAQVASVKPIPPFAERLCTLLANRERLSRLIDNTHVDSLASINQRQQQAQGNGDGYGNDPVGSHARAMENMQAAQQKQEATNKWSAQRSLFQARFSALERLNAEIHAANLDAEKRRQNLTDVELDAIRKRIVVLSQEGDAATDDLSKLCFKAQADTLTSLLPDSGWRNGNQTDISNAPSPSPQSLQQITPSKGIAGGQQPVKAAVSDASARTELVGPVYLSDLAEQKVACVLDADGKQAFGKNGCDEHGSAISVNGIRSPKGIFLHPPAQGSAVVTYLLDHKFRALTCQVGINDSAGRGAISATIFKIVGDGKVLWTSKPFTKGRATEVCRVDVTGLTRLNLVVECPGANQNAHAVWLEPRLTVAGNDATPNASPKSADLEARTDVLPELIDAVGIIRGYMQVSFEHETLTKEITALDQASEKPMNDAAAAGDKASAELIARPILEKVEASKGLAARVLQMRARVEAYDRIRVLRALDFLIRREDVTKEDRDFYRQLNGELRR